MKTNNTNNVNPTNAAAAGTAKTGGFLARLSEWYLRLREKFAILQERIQPAVKVFTIIDAVYSAVAVFLALQSFTGIYILDRVTDSAPFNVMFTALFVAAMVGLVITGGILTALELLLRAEGKIFTRGGIFDVGSILGFIISLILHVGISLLLLFVVAIALGVAPIVPIMIHNHRKAEISAENA